MKRLPIFLFLFCLLLTIPCQAKIITVDDDEPADFDNIQAAINDARDGDTIIVADGTYTGQGNRDISFLGKAITLRSESGPQSCIIDCEALERGFYFGQGENANSILDGFTITNARASVATIWCDDSSPTITNCDISGNWATDAGGIYTGNYSSPRISNCTIAGNSGGLAGGIGCFGNPTIINCNIIGNLSRGGDGGGMQFYMSSRATVANCIVRGNSPEQIDKTMDNFPSVSYSNVQGGGGGVGGIDKDPCFAFATDYHLMPDSPCIDAGTNNPPGGLPTHDPDGNARPLDGDGDTNSIADIGVYEFNAYQPSIALSANRMEFFMLQAGPDPNDQNLSIRNCSAGTLVWEIIEDCSWLEVNPRNGESVGDIDDVSVSIRASGLPGGRHDCELRISADGAVNSPRMVVVTVHIHRELHVPSEYGTIQSAIDAALAGDTIIVADGIYTGDGNRDVEFLSKAITVRSQNGPETCVIDCNGTETEPHRGFNFYNGEDSNSVLDGFTITNGNLPGGGIRCYAVSPTIRNCIITKNRAGNHGGGILCIGCKGATLDNCLITENSAVYGGGIGSSGDYSTRFGDIIVTNCTFSANSAQYGGAVYVGDGSKPSMVNCILWGDTAMYGPEIALEGFWPVAFLYVSFSDVQGGEADVYDYGYLYWEPGNIDADPCFSDPCNGDYHLKSEVGRWDPNSESWVQDDVTSPCIDAGNPGCLLGSEPAPNGNRRNMGAYGGTVEASKSPVNWRSIADMTNDWVVDFNDLKVFINYWLYGGQCIPSDLNRSQSVDFNDFAIFGMEWMEKGPGPGITYEVDKCIPVEFGSFVAEEPGHTRFSVRVEGNNIHFEDLITANCCADEIELQMTVDGKLITIYEIEHLIGVPCPCICDYPVTATLGPFEEGNYLVEVIGINGSSLGVVEVTIGETTGPGIEYQIFPCDSMFRSFGF